MLEWVDQYLKDGLMWDYIHEAQSILVCIGFYYYVCFIFWIKTVEKMF